MKTPYLFDYDLWTTEEGCHKHYWVRVKSTGEVAEVSHEVMKYLRASEKSLRRTIAATSYSDDEMPAEKNTELCKKELSLSFVSGDDTVSPSWLVDPVDYIANAITDSLEVQFSSLLTAHQLEIYRCCIKEGMGIREYAERHHCHHSSVEEVIRSIQKKFQEFYFDTPPKSQ